MNVHYFMGLCPIYCPIGPPQKQAARIEAPASGCQLFSGESVEAAAQVLQREAGGQNRRRPHLWDSVPSPPPHLPAQGSHKKLGATILREMVPEKAATLGANILAAFSPPQYGHEGDQERKKNIRW